MVKKIINNFKQFYNSKRIGVPFKIKKVIFTSGRVLPIGKTSYIDNATSNLDNNEVYMVFTKEKMVCLYKVSKFYKTQSYEKIADIKFVDYLTMYYDFNNEKYISLVKEFISTLKTYFNHNKNINNTYDDLVSEGVELRVKLPFIDSNEAKEKFNLSENDDLYVYFNVDLKMQMNHSNSNYFCDLTINHITFFDDDEVVAFTNFTQASFKSKLDGVEGIKLN